LVYVADGHAGLQIIGLRFSPLLPIIPDLQSTSDTGISDIDNITADTTPTFSVCLPNGYYFRFYCDGELISREFEPFTPFTAPVQEFGIHYYTLALVDTAGNVSKSSAALTVTISGSTVVGHYVYYPDSILGIKSPRSRKSLFPRPNWSPRRSRT
jgi:hypothetical protein